MCLNIQCTHSHPLGIKLNLLVMNLLQGLKVLRLLLCQLKLLLSNQVQLMLYSLICSPVSVLTLSEGFCPYLLRTFFAFSSASFFANSSLSFFFSTFLVSFSFSFCFSLSIASPSALVKTRDQVTLVSAAATAGIY